MIQVDYVLYLLGKSCKLVPLMFVHFILYRTVYPRNKYLVAGVITIGVVIFSLSDQKSKRSDVENSNNGYGLALLMISLLLDGFMNSTQDKLIKSSGLNGSEMMVILNIFTMINLIIYSISTGDSMKVINFLKFECTLTQFKDILLFGICGAIGQVGIFITLQHFSSVVLVTVTVTRKMISMLLSVILFGKSLNYQQWLGLFLVLGGILGESWSKLKFRKGKQE